MEELAVAYVISRASGEATLGEKMASPQGLDYFEPISSILPALQEIVKNASSEAELDLAGIRRDVRELLSEGFQR